MSYYSLRIALKGLPKTTNTAGSGKNNNHWARKRERDHWKAHVGGACMGKHPDAPLKKAKLILTRHSSIAPDFDGLVSSFKHVVDGLVECGVLEDDSLDHIGMPSFHWIKSLPNDGYIVVEVIGV